MRSTNLLTCLLTYLRALAINRHIERCDWKHHRATFAAGIKTAEIFVSVQLQQSRSIRSANDSHQANSIKVYMDQGLVHTLQKLAPEIGAKNSTPDSVECSSCQLHQLHQARKNWRQFMASKLMTAYDRDAVLFIRLRLSLNSTPGSKYFAKKNLLVIQFFSSHHSILQFQDEN